MKRAVFDTNVVVSGFLSPTGPPGRIVDWLRSGQIQAVLDDRIAIEYREVLTRPRFRLPAAEVSDVLKAILGQAFWVEAFIGQSAVELPDPDDLPFLECAWAANVPLVTGNIRHFPKSIAKTATILSPAKFVADLM